MVVGKGPSGTQSVRACLRLRTQASGIDGKRGQSLNEIGRAFGKHAGSIHSVVSPNGGLTPAVRRRWRWALTLAEREEISRRVAIARSICSLEIHRHGEAPVSDR